MKLKILDKTGTEKGSVDLKIAEAIRPDLIKRAVLSLQSRARQPYGADPRAGLKHSTRISKRRRDYRGSYGFGISRTPRKILSRNGTRMYWVGAEAPNTVGGRRAHPPKSTKKWEKKINRKENRKAINSAICAALDASTVKTRGHHIPNTYPFAITNDFEKLTKTKDVLEALKKLGFTEDLVRGENGGRSLLIVTESSALARAAENIPGVDTATAASLNAELLAPGAHPGRATLFTEDSIAILNGEKPKEAKKDAAETPKKTVKKAAKKSRGKKPAKKPAKKKTSKPKAESSKPKKGAKK